MRSAFSMIELIFVILILGILAAVSLPRFIGVSETAHETVCKAFVGTLNRTVSHSIWSNSMMISPRDFNMTLSKLQKNIKEQSECGVLSDYVAATKDVPFTMHIGNNDYNISGVAADSKGPARWKMSRL